VRVDGAAVATGWRLPPAASWRGTLRGLLTAWVVPVRGARRCYSSSSSTSAFESFVQLPAVAAAILGLGLNYGAHRKRDLSGARAVPPGQLEAARRSGLRVGRRCGLVRGPQAFGWRWRR
jgi:ABC-type amino acid transport system permease subunit